MSREEFIEIYINSSEPVKILIEETLNTFQIELSSQTEVSCATDIILLVL